MALPASPTSKSDPGTPGSEGCRQSMFGPLEGGGDGIGADAKRESMHSMMLDASEWMTASLTETPKLMSSFFQSSVQHSFLIGDDEPNAKLRRSLHYALRSRWNTVFTLVIVLVDFAMSCADTDLRAAGYKTPFWMEAVVYSCLMLYSTEFCMRIFVFRSKLLDDKRWTLLDFTVCSVGLIDVALKLAHIEQTAAVGSLRLMRLARAFRMLRVLRGVAQLRELKRLVQMAANCLKTLIWSFLFCFGVMTSWSLVAVEVVHPLVQELGKLGQWDDCNDCPDAFSTIFHSNLTLFSTIVAGDSWGKLAIPVMKAYPVSAVFFIGAHLTLVYGVLNLIVAVVVDTFAEQRAKDESMLAHELEEDYTQDTKEWTKVFKAMDSDGDGTLSLDELVEAARNLNEFRDRLRILDIDENDLTQLFNMLDSDSSGDIEPGEFIGALVRWKHESKSASRFVKYNMERSLRNEEEMLQIQQLLASKCKSIEENLQMLCDDAKASFRMDRTVSDLAPMIDSQTHSNQVKSYRSARRNSVMCDSSGRPTSLPSRKPNLRVHVPQDPAARAVADDEVSSSRETECDEQDISISV